MPEPKRPLKVFLCHASADKPKVRELYRTLKRRGVQPWLDAENLIPGQNWEVEIPKALYSSDAIIICLTPNSVDKEGYVQKEIKFALDKALEMPEGRIFLIPARLEDCDLPFSLRQYQAVNLYEKEGYVKLMKALKLRASQLERSTVDLPKAGETTAEIEKVVEEKKPPEPEEEKLEIKTPEPSAEKIGVGGDVKDRVIAAGSGRDLNSGSEEQLASEKPGLETPQPKKTNSPRKPNTAIIVAVIGLIGTLCAALISSPMLANLFSLTPEPTTIVSTPYTDAKDVTMRLVPADEFTMGSENDEDLVLIHQVYLNAFYMDIYEVTNAAYKACVDAGGCTPPQNTSSSTHSSYYGNSQFDNYPVIYVDWNQAQTYCEWRGASLPTEAQWEKAARGTDARTYPWGDRFDDGRLNFCDKNCSGNWPDKNGDDGYADTAPVGSYESGKSAYGIYDMAGNVNEWVADWFDSSYYANSPSSNPLGPNSGQYRVVRGGSWDGTRYDARSAVRAIGSPDGFADQGGFRCARSSP